VGEGKDRLVRMTLKLIAQEPRLAFDPAELEKEYSRPLNEEGFLASASDADEEYGIPIRRLSHALLAQASQNVAPDHRDSRV
jgi:hypothetical protein